MQGSTGPGVGAVQEETLGFWKEKATHFGVGEHTQSSEQLALALGMKVVPRKQKQNKKLVPPLFQKISKTIKKSWGAKLPLNLGCWECQVPLSLAEPACLINSR